MDELLLFFWTVFGTAIVLTLGVGAISEQAKINDEQRKKVEVRCDD